MQKLYSTQRVNFTKPGGSEPARDEHHRTLRAAVELSSASYSYQQTRGGKAYQWDNIAPEVALVILQDALGNNIFIKQEVIAQYGSEKAYNDAVLTQVLEILNTNPDYALFTEKLALHITGEASSKLTLENVNKAGINRVEAFAAIYTPFLTQQKKLAKNIPNFGKINNTDDYDQVLNYLTSTLLYDKFLKSFTENLALEYNANVSEDRKVKAPTVISKQSLQDFFERIGYDLTFKKPEPGKLANNVLYMQIINDTLHYTVKTANGLEVTHAISQEELNFSYDRHTTKEELKNILPRILDITTKRGHTSNFGLNNTESLTTKATDFLEGEASHDLFLSYLPSLDLVKDEDCKHSIYNWLKQGNMPRLKDLIADGANARYKEDLKEFIDQANASFPQDEEFKENVESVSVLMNEIVDLVSSLDSNPNEKNKVLDEKIQKLTEHLKWLKIHYTRTPLLKPGEDTPSTEGNFAEFARKVLFNSSSNKVINYFPDAEDTSIILKLDLIRLVNNLIYDDPTVIVRDITSKGHEILNDAAGFAVSPAFALREQMKKRITNQLKSNTHHYYVTQSQENDPSNLSQTPASFRSTSLSESFASSKAYAKRMTKSGEYTADSHLFLGQESQIKKHEIRSGTGETLITTTRKFDIDKAEIQLSGNKDIKIMYILRGKEGLHSHSSLIDMEKNELAYTHIDPSDYVMTILYDKDNKILGVIPGNISGEIQGVNDFTQKVLDAAIEFYNLSHKQNASGTVLLPTTQKQKKSPVKSWQEKKSFLSETKTSSTQENTQAKTLASIRISRHYTTEGNKTLRMATLRPETKETPPHTSSITLPKKPFKFDLERFNEVRNEANRHYKMRHVVTLKRLSQWTEKEKNIQLSNNRILQSGFMEGDIDQQLKHAQIAKEEWLTDVLVPKTDTALLLNIAARLITDYAVDIEEVNDLAQTLSSSLFDKHAFELMEMKSIIAAKLDPLDQSGLYQQCLTKAKEKMATLYPHYKEDSNVGEEALYYKTYLASCLEMELNRVRKQMINELVSKFLDSHLENDTQQLGLEHKPVHEVGDNRDFVFLGPAASGKSTISSQYISKADRKNYVSLATDDCRGIYKLYTQEFEDKETEQVFVRTQDSAFLVSELVEMIMKSKNVVRADIIVDGVTYKVSHRKLVEQNDNSIIVCACLDDMTKAVKRSYDRAVKEDAGSADKGRYVNTNSLIDMHKSASLNLIKYCALNTTITFYDTNIQWGTKPPLIATVDTHGDKTLTVSSEKNSLMRLTSFFNKSRANVNAQSDASLFFHKLNKPEFQVDSLLATLDFGYTIILNGENDKPCLTIQKDTDGKIIMEVNNLAQLKSKQMECTGPEKAIMNMLLLYTKYGSLKELNKQRLLHDNKVELLVNKFFDSIVEQESTLGKDSTGLTM